MRPWVSFVCVVGVGVAAPLLDSGPLDWGDFVVGISLAAAACALFRSGSLDSTGAFLMTAAILWFAGNFASVEGLVGDVASQLRFVHRAPLLLAFLVPLTRRVTWRRQRLAHVRILLELGLSASVVAAAIIGTTANSRVWVGCTGAAAIVVGLALSPRRSWSILPAAFIAVWTIAAAAPLSWSWLDDSARVAMYRAGIVATAVSLVAARRLSWRADDVVQFSQTLTAGIRVGFEDGDTFRLSTGELLVEQPGERSFEIDLGPQRGHALILYSDRAVAEPRLRPELAAAVGLLADHHRLVQQLRRDSEAVAASGRRLMTIDELSHDALVDELQRTLLPRLKELRAESQKLTDLGVRTWVSQATLSVEHELDAVSSTRGVSAKELVPELMALAGRFDTPIQVSAGDVQVDDLSARTLLYVASEATVNAIKHGDCSSIWIDLQQVGDDVVLSVGDDGRGGARIQPRHGLEGLRDRLAPLRGSLTIADTPGSGTTISVRLPAVSERASVNLDKVAG
jgi:hypothetical protein